MFKQTRMIDKLIESGVSQKHARAFADSWFDAFQEGTQSMASLKDLDVITSKIDNKIDASIARQSNKIIIWTISAMLTISAVTLAIAKLVF